MGNKRGNLGAIKDKKASFLGLDYIGNWIIYIIAGFGIGFLGYLIVSGKMNLAVEYIRNLLGFGG